MGTFFSVETAWSLALTSTPRAFTSSVSSEQPIVEMTEELVEQKLEEHVLHDDDELQTFGAWWKTVEDDKVVEAQYPHERHGLAGKASNHSKQQVMAQFLEFVDSNSQPNGRQVGSYSAQFFFLPKFTRIAAPKEGGITTRKQGHR